jgi:peptidoglycan/LPS O-acetylase OafA/YrhL
VVSKVKQLLAGRFVGQQGRMPGLDALRGIAALAVVLFHYTAGYAEVIGPHNAGLWFNFPYASIGVQAFFAISGFVIFMTLERCRNGRDFFVSRFARLYPPFLACMLLTAAVIFIGGYNPRNLRGIDVLLNLPMVVGLLDRVYVDGSYWTLTCEISFYLLISVFFYQVQRRVLGRSEGSFDSVRNNPLLFGVALWMVVTVLGRTHADDMFTRWSLAFNFLYGHLFVIGIAVYGLTKGRLLVPLLLLGMAVLAGSMPQLGQYSIGASVKFIGIAALIWAAAHLRVQGRAAALAGFLGGISYSLYLLHQMLGYTLINKLETAGVGASVAILFTMALMIGVAYLVRRYVEIPAQNGILAWYAPWKSKPLTTASAGPA